MRMVRTGLALACFICALVGMCALPYLDCPEESRVETRKLYVATCDTRMGWKSHNALRAWNSTGHRLREDDNLHMENVCYAKSWGKHGFLTKPMLYKKFMLRLPENAYVILMDSDTFWAVRSLKRLWHKFDCARGGKDVVLSTEMQCWVGRYCTADDLKRWYSNLANTPSYSPFANSGIVMGRADKIIKMLSFVTEHNADYFVEKPGGKMKFDDQYAIADYAINVNPADVALDYHQQLLASFSIHTPQETNVIDTNWGFVCKQKDGSISMNCPDFTNRMNRRGFFHLDEDTCLVTRKINPRTDLLEYVRTLAPDPAIWHGNGVGKRLYIPLMDMVWNCELTKRGMSIDDFHKSNE